MSNFTDFFKGFIEKYLDNAKRVYGYYSSSGFNKEELAKLTKELYDRVITKVEQDQLEQKIEESKAEQNKK